MRKNYYNTEIHIPTISEINTVQGKPGKRVYVLDTKTYYYWDIEDESWSLESSAGGSISLNQTLQEGNDTDGEDIIVSENDRVVVGFNRAGIGKGTFDTGGDGGVSQYCAVGFELNYQAGKVRQILENDISLNPKSIQYASDIQYDGFNFVIINESDGSGLQPGENTFVIEGDFSPYFQEVNGVIYELYGDELLATATLSYFDYDSTNTGKTTVIFFITKLYVGLANSSVWNITKKVFDTKSYITVEEVQSRYNTYKQYTCQLFQEQTNPIFDNVLGNHTFSDYITWQRLDVGTYRGTLEGGFPELKTRFIHSGVSRVFS